VIQTIDSNLSLRNKNNKYNIKYYVIILLHNIPTRITFLNSVIVLDLFYNSIVHVLNSAQTTKKHHSKKIF